MNQIDIEQLVGASGEDLAGIFIDWRIHFVGISELLREAIKYFKIPLELSYVADAFNVSAVADDFMDNPYHNSHHFREVTASMVRLIDAHNKYFEPKLEAKEICKCLIAAIGHDLDHLGRANMFAFEQEDIAIYKISQIVDMSSEDFKDISLMIKSTDIENRNLLEEGITSSGAVLRAMIYLLCDADVAASTATTYSFNLYLSTLLARENDKVKPTSENLLSFISHAIGENYLSPAAQKINGPALQKVKAHAARAL